MDAVVEKFALCAPATLLYMSGGHLPPAPLALYTEFLDSGCR